MAEAEVAKFTRAVAILEDAGESVGNDELQEDVMERAALKNRLGLGGKDYFVIVKHGGPYRYPPTPAQKQREWIV